MRVVGTHHVALATNNFERLREFYVETLGLPVVGAFPGDNIVFIDAGSTTIELTREEGERSSDAGGWSHLALEVPDVVAAYRELSARGVAFHVPPEDFPLERPTMRIAFFRDPDGNVVELIQPLGDRYPAARWP